MATQALRHTVVKPCGGDEGNVMCQILCILCVNRILLKKCNRTNLRDAKQTSISRIVAMDSERCICLERIFLFEFRIWKSQTYKYFTIQITITIYDLINW